MSSFFDKFFGGGGAAAGNMFGGGMYGDLLSPEQQAALRRQSMMQVAAKLLESSGPSPTRRTLGQTLGSALGAGAEAMQSGQTNAVQQMLLKQKLDEARDARAAAENIRGIFTPPAAQVAPVAQATGAPLSAEQALIASSAGRVGPTPQRQSLMTPGAVMPTTPSTPPAPPMGLREFAASLPLVEQQALQVMAQTDPNAAVKALNDRYQASSKALSDRSMAASKFGKPEFFVRNGRPVAIQYNEFGEGRPVQDVQPYEAMPQDIRAFEYISGQPLAGTGQAGVQALGTYRGQIAPRTNVTVPVDMTGGQKGFENEMKLGSAFKAEPIYKEFNDMSSAFGQVVSSLSQGTPIGDVAGATKIMKLLDPGSVVRESELGIAMAASGRLDRLKNYFNNMVTGQLLTPTQRQDFKRLASELYAAAADGYNKKRDQYEEFGQAYGFKNLNTVLGPKAKAPSIMRSSPTAGGETRPPLGSIFGSPQ